MTIITKKSKQHQQQSQLTKTQQTKLNNEIISGTLKVWDGLQTIIPKEFISHFMLLNTFFTGLENIDSNLQTIIFKKMGQRIDKEKKNLQSVKKTHLKVSAKIKANNK